MEAFLAAVLMGIGVWLVYIIVQICLGHGGRQGHGKHEARGAGGDQSVKVVLNPAGRAYWAVRFAFCHLRNGERLSGF